MRINSTKLINLAFGAIVMLALSSCFKIGRTVAPSEVAGNATFDGRIKVVNDGNNSTQTGLSFFAIRVPQNWNVTVDDASYKQFAKAGTVNDEGDPVNMERSMRYCSNLADNLNITNPKEGYTWYAFQTNDCIRRNIQGSNAQGCDSVCFDYKVINDGLAGDYELDYMVGSVETSDPYEFENNPRTHLDMAGTDIYKSSTEATNIADKEFNSVLPEFRSKVKVLEGGTVVDNSPRITCELDDSNVNVEYFNMNGNIALYKGGSTLALPYDYEIAGTQKFNDGCFEWTIEDLEPGIYYVRSVATGAEDKFVIGNRPFDPKGTSIFVIGNPGVVGEGIITNMNEAYYKELGSDPANYEYNAQIMAAMTDSILTVKPAVVLVTGDLTKAGEKVSHEALAEMLKTIEAAGIKAYVVPGDKDVNNPNAYAYIGEEKVFVENISAEQFAEIYADYGYTEAISRDANTLSYMVYPNETLAVLAIDACQYADNVRGTSPEADDATVNSTGVLTEETLKWARRAVRVAQGTGRSVVAMMHHIAAAPFNGYESLGSIVNNTEAFEIGSIFGGDEETTEAKRITAAESGITLYTVQEELADMGVDVLFASDTRANDIQKITTASGRQIIQVLTSPANAYDCPFRLVDVNEDGLDIQTRFINNLVIDGVNLQKYGYSKISKSLPAIVSAYTEENWETIHAFLLKQFTFDYDPETDLINKNDFFKLPETPEAAAALVNDNVIPPLVDIILAFVDGNEHLKNSQTLVDNMHTGVDAMISGINTFPSIINPMVKEGFATAGLDLDAMIDSVVGSLAYNYVGEDTDNVTNDLYGSFTFQNQNPLLIGDVNQDGSVTMTDANQITNMYVNEGGDGDLEAADLNGDFNVTMVDANAIVNVFVNQE